MSKDYFTDFSLSASTSFDTQRLDELLNATLSSRCQNCIFTIVTKSYVEMAKTWTAYLDKLEIKNFFLVCADESSQDTLHREGRKTLLVKPNGVSLSTSQASLEDSIMLTDMATYAIRLKFLIAYQVLARGTPAIFSDVDALWLSDPQPDLSRSNYDIAFQVASFPPDVKSVWGFTACTGFVAFDSSASSLKFLERVNASFKVDDQSAFNRVLLHHYNIKWGVQSAPTQWEHCDLGSGWTEKIFGFCRKTGLTVAALPHCFYQRHSVTASALDNAIICHPNSPLTEEGKLDVFRKLGLA